MTHRTLGIIAWALAIIVVMVASYASIKPASIPPVRIWSGDDGYYEGMPK